MKKLMSSLVAVSLMVGLFALPAAAHKDQRDFVDFVSSEAEKKRGQFNIVSNVVLALAGSGDLTADDLAALGTAEITAFLPNDYAFRKLTADLQGKRWWQVKEAEVIPFLADALGLPTIAEVVKYHIYAGGKVDYATAISLDTNPGNGTDVFIEVYNGGQLGIDRRGPFLQLDDAGNAGFGTNNPWVVRRNIDAGNALVHGINRVLLP